MKQNKKIAITHYISIRFSAIIFIMAAIMILSLFHTSQIKPFILTSDGKSGKKHTMIFSILIYKMEKYS